MDIRVQTLVNDLKDRKNSLQPPYPSFGDHIREILRFIRAPELGELVGVQEGAVNDWSADGKPGTQLWTPIKEVLGYSMVEYFFCKAAQEVGFPVLDEADPLFRSDLLSITTVEALRRYLQKAEKIVIAAEIARVCDSEKTSLANFTGRGVNPRADMFPKILKGVMKLALYLDGAVLSTATPRNVAIAVAERVRLEHKIGVKRWVELLSDPEQDLVITEGFYKHWRNSKTDGKPLYYKDRERAERMLARIDDIRYGRRAIVPTEAQDIEDDSAAEQPAMGIKSSGVNEELLDEVLGVHRELHDHTRNIKGLLTKNEHKLKEQLGAIADTLSKVHAIMEQYGLDPCQHEPVAHASQGSNGAKEQITVEVAVTNDTAEQIPPHLPPLTHARGKTHTFVPDKYRLRLLRLQMQVIAEELGNILLIEDDAVRQSVCEDLAIERHELTVAVRAMSLGHPAGQFDIWDAQRRLMGLHSDVEEIQKGEKV